MFDVWAGEDGLVLVIRHSYEAAMLVRWAVLLVPEALLLLDLIWVHGCLRGIRLLQLVIWRFSQLTTAFEALLL